MDRAEDPAEATKWAWPPNIPKTEWGRRGWRWLHITAINYANRPSIREAQIIYGRIWSFIGNLPCEECRSHALQHILAHPPDLASSSTLQRWVFDFHNAVNARLGTPVITYEQYRGLYLEEICWAASGTTCDLADAWLARGLTSWRKNAARRLVIRPLIPAASPGP